MRLSIKNALLFSGIYILMELIIFMLGYNSSENIMVVRIVGASLLMLLAVAISILVHFNRNKRGGLSMLVDLKMGIGAAAIFALIVSLFLTLYFSAIDTEFVERREKQLLELIEEKESQEIVKEKYAENPNAFGTKTDEDVIEQNIDNIKHMMQPTTIFPMALFSLLLLGMIYAFGVTALNRLILSKL